MSFRSKVLAPIKEKLNPQIYTMNRLLTNGSNYRLFKFGAKMRDSARNPDIH